MDQFKEQYTKAAAKSDGLLSRDEFYEFFKQYDPDLYIGAVTNLIDKFNYDFRHPGMISLPEAAEYYSAYKNTIQYLFDIKYEILRDIYRMRVDAGLEHAGVPPIKGIVKDLTAKPQTLNLKLKVGDVPEVANRFHLKLKKKPQASADDYFVKVEIRTSSEQNAQKLADSFNNFYKNLFEALIEEFPESAYLLNHLDVEVSRANTWVQVGCKSNCPELNEILRLWISMLNQLTDRPTGFELNLKIDAGFSFKNFLNVDTENFYNIITQNFSVGVELKTQKEVSEALKMISMLMEPHHAADAVKSADFLHERLINLYLCWTELLDVDIELDNTPVIKVSEDEQESLKEIKFDILMAGPAEIMQTIQESYSFGKQLMDDLNNLAQAHIRVSGVINEIEFSLNAEVHDLGLLYKKVCQATIEEDD